jgi:Fe-S-cluster containining protein
VAHHQAQRDGSEPAGETGPSQAARRSLPLPVVGGPGNRRDTALTGRAADALPEPGAGPSTPAGDESRLLLRSDDGLREWPLVPVDCSARIQICQAVCCKLDFALTREEVLAGRVQWDLARPFFVGRATNGYCVHNDRRTGGCGVYANRPAVCKRWSCANDARIWNDFEQLELNVEWLSANGFIGEGWALTSPARDGARSPHATEPHPTQPHTT